MRIRRQILRWVDKGSQDGYTDQTVISTIGMKGEDKALGYTWDYRNYGARNPQAYNDPKLFEEYSRQDKPEYRNLTWLHSGTKDTKIRQGERKNEELALNVADGLMSFVNPNPRVKAPILAGVGNLKNIRSTVTGSDPLLAGAGNIRIPVNGNVAKGDRIPDTALATTEHKYKGGAHSETKKPTNDGLDSHHCPAKDCYKGAPLVVNKVLLLRWIRRIIGLLKVMDALLMLSNIGLSKKSYWNKVN